MNIEFEGSGATPTPTPSPTPTLSPSSELDLDGDEELADSTSANRLADGRYRISVTGSMRPGLQAESTTDVGAVSVENHPA